MAIVCAAAGVVTTVPVANGPAGAAYDSGNGYVYVANSYSNNVSVINGTKVVATVPVGNYPDGVAYDSHVFRSADGGLTWADIDRGRLPDVPHNSLVIPGNQPQTLYVCSDAGVHASTDMGNSWFDLTRNLPRVRFVDIVHHAGARVLMVATYGRSIWRLAAP